MSVEDLAVVRRRVDVPIAADESIRRAEDPYRVRDLEAADIAVLKVQPLGGVRACLRIAEDIGLPVVVSSAVESSVGIAAGVALAAALPELHHACGLATVQLLTDDVAVEPLLPVDGMLAGRPGPRSTTTRCAGSRPPDDRVDHWRRRLDVGRAGSLLVNNPRPELARDVVDGAPRAPPCARSSWRPDRATPRCPSPLYDAAQAGRRPAPHPHRRAHRCASSRSGLAKVEPRARRPSSAPRGTAVANLLPAVMEAAHAGVPLVVVTADRPARLRGTGANQTTDQVGIFGDLRADPRRRRAADLDELLAFLRAHDHRRPVHLNVQLDDPLLPDDDGWDGGEAPDVGGRPPVPGTRRASTLDPGPAHRRGGGRRRRPAGPRARREGGLAAARRAVAAAAAPATP